MQFLIMTGHVGWSNYIYYHLIFSRNK